MLKLVQNEARVLSDFTNSSGKKCISDEKLCVFWNKFYSKASDEIKNVMEELKLKSFENINDNLVGNGKRAIQNYRKIAEAFFGRVPSQFVHVKFKEFNRLLTDFNKSYEELWKSELRNKVENQSENCPSVEASAKEIRAFLKNNVDIFDLKEVKFTDSFSIEWLPTELSLPKLKKLKCESPHLTFLQSGILDGFQKICSLSLSNSKITKLPKNIFDKNRRLEKLCIDSNKNLNKLPIGVFDELEILKHLLIKNNKLTYLRPGIFDKLKNLMILEVSNEGLMELPKEVFDKLKNLVFLSLEKNHLSHLRGGILDELKNLGCLELQDNELTDLPPGIFKNMRLNKLNISNNRFISIPKAVYELKDKCEIDLSGNSFILLSAEDMKLFSSESNRIYERFNEEISYSAVSPVAKIYQIIRDDYYSQVFISFKYLKNKYDSLSEADKDLLLEVGCVIIGKQKIDHIPFKEVYVCQDEYRFAASLQEMIRFKFSCLNEEQLDQVARIVHKLAGSPETDNVYQWGLDNAFLNFPRLADALSSFSMDWKTILTERYSNN